MRYLIVFCLFQLYFVWSIVDHFAWSPDNLDAVDLRVIQIVETCQSQGYWDTGTVRITCAVTE